MKIRGWAIDGFGVFRDYRVDALPDGLSIFHGPNEAGKTTLLAFLRGALFGFPDRRSRQSRFPPLRGGHHGGRLFLGNAAGEVVVERDASGRGALRVTLPDGARGDESDLQRLLAGADSRLFRSVFAFSLSELQSFESLTADGVRDRIFTAGVAGAGRSARQALDRLNDQARLLLKRSGRARINELLAELEATGTRLAAARAAALEYDQRVSDEEQARAAIETARQNLVATRAEVDHWRALLDAWPTYSERQQAATELAGLEPIEPPPPWVEARLAANEARREAAKKSLQILEEEERDTLERRLLLEQSGQPIAGAAQISALAPEICLRRDRLLEINTRRRKGEERRTALNKRLAELGGEWNEESVPALLAKRIESDEPLVWQDRLTSMNEENRRAASALESARQRLTDLQTQQDAVSAVLPVEPRSLEDVQQSEARLRRSRINLIALGQAEAEIEAAEERVENGTQSLRALEAGTWRLSPTWVAAAMWVLALAGVAAAGWRGYLEDRVGAGGALAMAVVVVGLLEPLRRAAARRHCRRREHVEALVAQMEEAGGAREAGHQRAAALHSTLGEDGAALGLTAPLTFEQLDELHGNLNRERAARSSWEALMARLREIAARLTAARAEVQDYAAAAVEAERRVSLIQQQWAAWKEGRGIPAGFGPKDTAELLARVRLVGEAQALHDRAREELAILVADVEAWEGRARAALAADDADAKRLDGNELIDRVDGWIRACEAEARRRDELQRLSEAAAACGRRLERARGELACLEEDRSGLFAAAGARDEAELRARQAVTIRRQQLLGVIEECDRRLGAWLGEGDVGVGRKAALADGSPGEWSERIAAAEAYMRDAEAECDEAICRHYEAAQAVRELADSSAVAALEAESSSLRAELRTAVREWSKIALAHGLIEETLREFERTRQPAVLAEATRAFATITSGRYGRVTQDDDAEEIVVLDRDGRCKRSEELSRGTAEQLYLSVRIGLATEFARRSAPLPLIMDDVLVNFDPQRARAIAVALGEVAKVHQLLFFTCQPSTRDLLLEAAGAARVIEMS